MGRVSVSKSYAVLVGLEMYVKARKKAEDVVGRVRRHGHGKKEGEEVVVPEPGLEQTPSSMNGEGEETQQHANSTEVEKPPFDGTTKHTTTTDHTATATNTTTEAESHPENPTIQQQKETGEQEKQRKEEENMRQENRLTVEVLQKLNLNTGLTEPKGQKGGGDAEEAGATSLSPPPSHPHS